MLRKIPEIAVIGELTGSQQARPSRKTLLPLPFQNSPRCLNNSCYKLPTG